MIHSSWSEFTLKLRKPWTLEIFQKCLFCVVTSHNKNQDIQASLKALN